MYELFVGKPPFFTNNLVSLIKLITREKVKYTDDMSPEFVSFLKGLLEKDPSRRLNWPELLDHPFITKTPEEILEMEIEKKKYSRWIGLNFSEIVEANISDNPKVKKNLTAADQLNSTVAGQVEKHPLLFEDFDHHSIVSDQDHE